MSIQYNLLGGIFEAAFGIRPVYSLPSSPSLNNLEQLVGLGKFKPGQDEKRVEDVFSDAWVKGEHPEEIGRDVKSWMGTPILFPITFAEMKNVRTITPAGKIEMVSYGRFHLPAATLTDFTRAKNIVETEVATGWGTVKELFSFGDFDIKMRGLCLDEPDGKGGYVRTAQAQKLQLSAFEQACQSIPVEGSLFEDLSIDYIVIKELTFRQVEGKPWVIPFELTCKSDRSPELTINTGNLKRK